MTQLAGKLDTLYLGVNDFKKIGKRVVFVFFIIDSSHLSLHGWLPKTGSKWNFNLKHDVTLSVAGQSSVTFGPGDYFGDLILGDSTVTRLKDSISANKEIKFILFVPSKVSGYDPHVSHINYDIFFTNKDPQMPLVILPNPFVTGTGAKTNPSPPGSGE